MYASQNVERKTVNKRNVIIIIEKKEKNILSYLDKKKKIILIDDRNYTYHTYSCSQKLKSYLIAGLN